MPVVELKSNQALNSLTKEKDSRGSCFVITDRHAAVVLCCQRIPAAAAFLNRHICSEDKVSVASLYEACAKPGRLVHRRFAIVRVPIENVGSAFEEARRRHPKARALILTQPHRIQIV